MVARDTSKQNSSRNQQQTGLTGGPHKNIQGRQKDASCSHASSGVRDIQQALFFPGTFLGHCQHFNRQGRGAPRKYGKKINICKMFQYWARRFETATANIYGKEEKIRYYKKPLLWMPIKTDVLFVWAETSRGPIVLMCSNLDENPINVIELFYKRAKIETFFSILKNVFGGHQYHFWSKYLSPSSRTPKKNGKKGYSSNPEKTVVTYEAIHKFFNLQSITIGILQMISLKFPVPVITHSKIWMRTFSESKPSEFLVKAAVKNIILMYSIKMSQNPIIQIIRERQKEPDFDDKFNKAA
ncbi:MAG: hypothetical protein ABIA63_10815 [bacterium]